MGSSSHGPRENTDRWQQKKRRDEMAELSSQKAPLFPSLDSLEIATGNLTPAAFCLVLATLPLRISTYLARCRKRVGEFKYT